jgi:hypothetical protein
MKISMNIVNQGGMVKARSMFCPEHRYHGTKGVGGGGGGGNIKKGVRLVLLHHACTALSRDREKGSHYAQGR